MHCLNIRQVIRRGGQKGALDPPPLAGQNRMCFNFLGEKLYLFWCYFRLFVCSCPPLELISSTFYTRILATNITKQCFGFEIFWRQNIDKKRTRKMLMNLTPGKQSAYAHTDRQLQKSSKIINKNYISYH